MQPEGPCDHLSQITSLSRSESSCGFTTSCDKSRSLHPGPQGSNNLPGPLSARTSSHPPPHSPSCNHTGLSLFLEQAGHIPSSGAWHWLFPLPGMLFLRMSTRLPSLTSSPYSNVTFSGRPLLTILLKTAHPSLPIHLPSPLLFSIALNTISRTTYFYFCMELIVSLPN